MLGKRDFTSTDSSAALTGLVVSVQKPFWIEKIRHRDPNLGEKKSTSGIGLNHSSSFRGGHASFFLMKPYFWALATTGSITNL